MDRITNKKAKTDNREVLKPGAEIILTRYGTEFDTCKFTIIKTCGTGGTVVAYKVLYTGKDNNKYMYILKELYPAERFGKQDLYRKVNTLMIDQYESVDENKGYYSICRDRFIDSYNLQLKMINTEDRTLDTTTSLPIGLYEDRKSSSKGNYALYALFQYQNSSSLADNSFKERSLQEVLIIQRQLAQVVKKYHDQGYLWLDIKESNVGIVGEKAVQSVLLFDFGSLVSAKELSSYSGTQTPKRFISFSPSSQELLLPDELETLLNDIQPNSVPKDPSFLIEMINDLGKYGKQSDVFLLGSLLYKRLFGEVPTIDICKKIEKHIFVINNTGYFNGCLYIVKKKITEILSNMLPWDQTCITNRYKDVADYIEDLDLVIDILAVHSAKICEFQKSKNYPALCCKEYMETKLLAPDGKFFKLQKLNGIRFNSNVVQKPEKNHPIPAHEAIDSGRFVFLYGDGGMGKSTALFDYMQKPDTIAFYLELSRFNHNSTNQYIFDTILKEICKNFADTSFLNDYEYGCKSQTPAQLLERQLSLEIDEPEFILFLDGYNEINKDVSPLFDSEVKEIKEKWNNVRIVITGRTIPKDYDGCDILIYSDFNRFEFIGIAEDERRALVFKTYPETANRIQNDSRLWSILRIPMFMGMFLNLNVDTTIIVHTKGELLDRFITEVESESAKRIAENQTDNRKNAAVRSFLVQYALPSVANNMDQQRLFGIGKLYFINILKNAWNTYDPDNDLMVGSLLPIDIPEKPEKFSSIVTHILQTEACYCYSNLNSEISFTHQYFRDYFAAKHIQNILDAAQQLGNSGLSKDEQLQFIKDNGLDYIWSDEVCILLGEIIGDYKNEPGYKEE